MVPEASARILQFVYCFSFPDGTTREFELALDRETLAVVSSPRTSFPDWTALGYHQCPNCPLDEARHPRCPIAAEVVDAVGFLKDWRSFDRVETSVKTCNREYRKITSLQEAASALLGIYMVASGCPIMNKLRPMLGTHLPFMDADESAYRTISMYLTAQFFRHKHGQSADWSLSGLLMLLRDCRITNTGFVNRLRSLGISDAALNALAVLNMLGELTSMSLVTDDLPRWERIFAEHFETE